MTIINRDRLVPPPVVPLAGLIAIALHIPAVDTLAPIVSRHVADPETHVGFRTVVTYVTELYFQVDTVTTLKHQ